VPSSIGKALRPVKGQIVRLRMDPSRPGLQHVLRTEEVYLVPRPDGELVVGATVEEKGFDLTLTAGGVFELLRAADELLPGIRELELVEIGVGLRPGTPDNLPLIGPTETPGLVVAAGHYRNGILQAPLTADTIAHLLAKDEMPQEMVSLQAGRFGG
jgi:glycine oxidase